MQAPYVVAMVELAEGVRLTAQIVDCDPDDLDFGSKVRRVLRRLATEGDDGIIQYGYKFVPSIDRFRRRERREGRGRCRSDRRPGS